MIASKNNRFEQIVSGIKKIDKESRKKCNVSINSNTEAFLAIKLADFLSSKFTTLNYKLEVRPESLLNQLKYLPKDITKIKNDTTLRMSGFIDVVLYYSKTKRKEKPAHIIEFKRGKRKSNILKDCIRMGALVNYAQKAHRYNKKPTKSRLETAYFITTTSYDSASLDKDVKDDFSGKLEEVDAELTKTIKEVNLEYDIFKLGPAQINSGTNNKDVWAVVIEITPKS